MHILGKAFRPLTAAVTLAWPVAAVLMLIASHPDAFDASATRYGQNWPGDLRAMLLRAALETAVLVAVLRPWPFARSMWRLVVALVLFLPWTALHLLVGMHAGPVRQMHDIWLLLVSAGLIGGLVALGETRRRVTHSRSDHAHTDP